MPKIWTYISEFLICTVVINFELNTSFWWKIFNTAQITEGKLNMMNTMNKIIKYYILETEFLAF